MVVALEDEFLSHHNIPCNKVFNVNICLLYLYILIYYVNNSIIYIVWKHIHLVLLIIVQCGGCGVSAWEGVVSVQRWRQILILYYWNSWRAAAQCSDQRFFVHLLFPVIGRVQVSVAWQSVSLAVSDLAGFEFDAPAPYWEPSVPSNILLPV